MPLSFWEPLWGNGPLYRPSRITAALVIFTTKKELALIYHKLTFKPYCKSKNLIKVQRYKTTWELIQEVKTRE